MKTWALSLLVAATFFFPAHKAEARKAPKRKVVVISFNESEISQKRGPASIDDQKEADAEARHMARLAEATVTVIPEF